jgi:tRNA pseudouridine13 synthase
MPATDASIPDWPRAHGKLLFQGLIKQTPSDFEVAETLGFAPSGDGEHDFLWIEKTGANTAWVARGLARHAGVSPGDVGYAGMKDRQAVTRQWFSVRRPTGEGTDWSTLELDGVQVLDVSRNQKKLRRGVHAGNRFRIVVRHSGADHAAIEDRLGIIRDRGVPNYFGPQRFGHDGANLALAEALFEGKRLRRDKRTLALSAARSLLFNHVLAARVSGNSWDQALPGDVYNHEGSNSLFIAEPADQSLQQRLDELDAHPTGPLWGRPGRDANQQPGAGETDVVESYAALARGLEKAGASFGRRALRLAVRDLTCSTEADRVTLQFELRTGGYATTVLRELADVD